MTETTDKFDQWAIVELMGHQRIAGRVSEETIGGTSFLRVDVPKLEDLPAFTKFYGSSAIYAMTPVSEEVARATAMQIRERPVNVYELPADMQKRLPLGDDDHDDSDQPW